MIKNIQKLIIRKSNKHFTKKILERFLNIGLNFKLQKKVQQRPLDESARNRLLQDLPQEGVSLEALLKEFEEDIVPYSTNFGSSHFLGFPDAGNSIAAVGGAIASDLMQQNLINQSFCSPAGTFVEISVIRWLREIVGYKNQKLVNDIWDVGGIITSGGTLSNAVGMMLARERKQPGALEKGVTNPEKMKIVVPVGIGHYSVKSAQMWLGCGDNLLEVATDNFRYDLSALEQTLKEHRGSVMAVVAYAGDSRTMTIDHLEDIVRVVKSVDPTIWLHADACHGFSLGFSEKLRIKLRGIEHFDSVATDPHKVLLSPYTISALLVKNPQDMKLITSKSDLIMKEQFAFGQITPFLGSRRWDSLKLWMMMKNFGAKGLDELISKRHALAVSFSRKLQNDNDFEILNSVDLNAVAFFFTNGGRISSVDELNAINNAIHSMMLEEGQFHLHQFSIPDPGIWEKGALVYPLRFMCGNPNVTEQDLDDLIEYVRSLGRNIIKNKQMLNQVTASKIIDELRSFVETLPLGERDFFIVYGSHGSKSSKEDSDVDVLLVMEKYDGAVFESLKEFIIQLHKKYGLAFDEEVPYENKLVSTFADVEAAINLEPFKKPGTLALSVPPVEKTSEFLASRPIRLRLILNALTSPHMFLTGDKERYSEFKNRAEHAIIKLGTALSAKSTPTQEDIFNVLTRSPNGQSGEWWLGYKAEKPIVSDYLKDVVRLRYVQNKKPLFDSDAPGLGGILPKI